MQKYLPAIAAATPDALIVAGGTALSYGAGLVHTAAGFIVAGVLLIAFGVAASRKAAE